MRQGEHPVPKSCVQLRIHTHELFIFPIKIIRVCGFSVGVPAVCLFEWTIAAHHSTTHGQESVFEWLWHGPQRCGWPASLALDSQMAGMNHIEVNPQTTALPLLETERVRVYACVSTERCGLSCRLQPHPFTQTHGHCGFVLLPRGVKPPCTSLSRPSLFIYTSYFLLFLGGQHLRVVSVHHTLTFVHSLNSSHDPDVDARVLSQTQTVQKHSQTCEGQKCQPFLILSFVRIIHSDA